MPRPTDIYYRIPKLETDSVNQLEQHYRGLVETHGIAPRNPRYWQLWLRCHFELEKREEEIRFPKKEIHHET